MYKVNPSSYAGIFVMPADIADKYLKLTSGDFLKVIVFACRHADALFSAEDAAKAAGLSVEDAADALEYWCEAGILKNADYNEPEKPLQTQEAQPPAENKVPEKAPAKIKPCRLSYQQICARIEESSIVRELFREAQEKLGRTIGTDDQSALLNLHDFYGLPIEVILAICEYANTHGKSNNINYIFTVGADWSTREIDTIEAADEEFRKLEQISAIWPELCRVTGIKTKNPTTSQKKYIDIWTEEWKFSLNMIAAAFDEMSKHTSATSFPYMNKILAEWHSAGIKTPEQAAERQKQFELEKERKAVKNASKSSPYGVRNTNNEPNRPASYDIEKATEHMNTTVPKHKKKEKR